MNNNPFIHEALLQERLVGKVRCNTCNRHCVIVPNGKGWCRTRKNRGGSLFTTTYGALSYTAANPIEKKPLYHFHPGTLALTAGGWSCNFGCPWCHNWQITKKIPNKLEYTSPKEFVDAALKSRCAGTSVSLSEPTLLLEWSLDLFLLAKAYSLYNTFVTNGYMTPHMLNSLVDSGLDALSVDIKGDSASVYKYCQGIDTEKVWATCKLARLLGLHLEVTTLVIPGVNDAPEVLREIAGRIVEELGVEVPWHLTAYQPAYVYKGSPTPPETLHMAYDLGMESGLHYVYVGNLPGDIYQNTYCPNCGAVLIRRNQFKVEELRLRDGHCWQCNDQIPGVW